MVHPTYQGPQITGVQRGRLDSVIFEPIPQSLGIFFSPPLRSQHDGRKCDPPEDAAVRGYRGKSQPSRGSGDCQAIGPMEQHARHSARNGRVGGACVTHDRDGFGGGVPSKQVPEPDIIHPRAAPAVRGLDGRRLEGVDMQSAPGVLDIHGRAIHPSPVLSILGD
jgi:hypothetical protein